MYLHWKLIVYWCTTNWIRLWPKNHFNAVCLGSHSTQLENHIQIKWIISFPSPITPLRNEFVAAILPASRLFIFCLLAAFFPSSQFLFFCFFGRWAQHFVHFLWLLHIYAIKIANMPQRSHTTPLPWLVPSLLYATTRPQIMQQTRRIRNFYFLSFA